MDARPAVRHRRRAGGERRGPARSLDLFGGNGLQVRISENDVTDDDGSLQQGHDLLFDGGAATVGYDALRAVLGG